MKRLEAGGHICFRESLRAASFFPVPVDQRCIYRLLTLDPRSLGAVSLSSDEVGGGGPLRQAVFRVGCTMRGKLIVITEQMP